MCDNDWSDAVDCIHCPKMFMHCTKTGLCNRCGLDFPLPDTPPPNGLGCTSEDDEDTDMAGWSLLDNFNISTIF